MRYPNLIGGLFLLICIGGQPVLGQHSVARQWNEILLEAIRGDFARPTVHARNLFHISAAMYDAWAAYDDQVEPYLLGKFTQGYFLPFEGVDRPSNILAARQEAISYAAYRLITERFLGSPGAFETLFRCDSLMLALGYPLVFQSSEYRSGDPAALGNYIADGYLDYGLQDGSNEEIGYGNLFYQPVNDPLPPIDPGNPRLEDPNRWQPLSLRIFIDQSGNPVTAGGLPFLSPEWGWVSPFALTEADRMDYERDGQVYPVYHDPGPPAYLIDGNASSAEYEWGFALVAAWASHLDPADSVIWDISPGSQGNYDLDDFPRDLSGLRDFYAFEEGGDPGQGHDLNPHTGEAYPPNLVPRGDYTRILAEFWADGPDSETPPGHWFTILNYVSDHPEFEPRYRGHGELLPQLEWDIKAYFSLGGAMHDAAISAWSIKGYYDYIRPISAIRWMADQGQSSDPNLPNYDAQGLKLRPGLIELVAAGDPLAGAQGQHIGKIKLYSWRGPDFIDNEEVDVAGVGWILAENWWPYQRPSFVTPPFAGYVSGHSTFSRAAAEVLTLLTGDPFFPGGVGEFVARKNEFLVFEEGPSIDVVLQWATYRDASDQTSLSRIWGGIHPPVDDIPGRIIGDRIGKDAFALAEKYFTGTVEGNEIAEEVFAFPNPVANGKQLTLRFSEPVQQVKVELIDLQGRVVWQEFYSQAQAFFTFQVIPTGISTGLYGLRVETDKGLKREKILVE